MPHPSRTVTSPPDLDLLGDGFEAFHARFADLFNRSEPRAQAAKYLRGLLGDAERRNGWQLAEAMGDALPDRMQRLLNRADWSAVTARDRLRAFSAATLGGADAVGILDETGFLKKGARSVGVQRQYTGTAGKVENCQVGVFLAYDTATGHTFLDRALYLPRSWTDDPARCADARVPRAVRFRTKPQLALRMLRRAWRAGVPMAWVTADEVYGDDPALRAGIAAARRVYVLAVSATTPVWTTRPATAPPAPPPGARGRPRTRVQLAPGAPRATTVRAVTATWPAAAWHRLAVTEGEKGPITYDWAAARVVESRGRRPADDVWLLARRSVTDPTEIAWYLANAPADTPLATLARVAARRFVIEQCFEEAKDDVGLDHYEVRTWPAWHRHVTLVMMAHAWLASVRRTLHRTDPDLLAVTLPTPPAPAPSVRKKSGPHVDAGAPPRRGRSRKSAG